MPFRNIHAFYAILLGQLLSVVGSGMTRFGLSIWVFEQTGSARDFSLLIFFALIPMALGSLVAGPLVDRLPRRLVMIYSNSIASASTLVVVLLFYSGHLVQWHLYITLLINGLANAFLVPAFEASVPLLMPKQQLARASGLSQMVSALDPILSPVLAGVLVTRLGLGAVFIADIVTFLCGISTLLLCVVPNPAREATTFSFWHNLRFGWKYLWQRKPFVYLIIVMSVLMFMYGAVYALTGPLILSFADAPALGWSYACFGVGALLGALLVGTWGGPKRRMHGIIAGLFLASLGSIITGLRPHMGLIMLGFFLFGLGAFFLASLNRVIYQVKAAPELLGRVLSLRIMVGVTMQGIGILLAGFLASYVFEPFMQNGSAAAQRLASWLGEETGLGVETGGGAGTEVAAGRGVALLYIIFGLGIAGLALWALRPRVRLLEDALPDNDA